MGGQEGASSDSSPATTPPTISSQRQHQHTSPVPEGCGHANCAIRGGEWCDYALGINARTFLGLEGLFRRVKLKSAPGFISLCDADFPREGESSPSRSTSTSSLSLSPLSPVTEATASLSGMSMSSKTRSERERERVAAISRWCCSVEAPRSKALKKTTCKHMEQLKIGDGLKNFAKIHTNLVTCVVDKSRDLKARLVKCYKCKSSAGMIHSCLHCITLGCRYKGHMRDHYHDSGHPLVVDLTYGTVYCFKCTDMLFDKDVEAITLANEQRAEYMFWMPWPSRFGGLPLAEFFLRFGSAKRYCVGPRSTFGLRGLVNLGHTCFMNCIIQTLIHTPLLRDFFMTDKIVCNQKHDQKQLKPCVITQIFDLFQEFYNGSKTAVSLHTLLYKIWGNAQHLAGYEQQDAHEFFIAMLEALHLHFVIPNSNNVCKCVVDLIFLGRLQSSVTCMVCGHKSITVDPFWDISLDIILDNSDPKAEIGLHECLMRYTRVEHLGSGGMIRCKDCDRNQESTKQLKFKVLPLILCLHLKRFEHSTATTKKIDNFVRFPECLDLSPFTSMHEDKRKTVPMSEYLYRQKEAADYRYSLYAVVNHMGVYEGGHYIAFIRHTRDAWYKCDDHMITKATREEVLASPGYLLFYHKEALLYDENDDRSC